MDDIEKLTRPLPTVGHQIVYEIARDKVQTQFGQSDGLDNKIAAYLTFGGALVALTTAVLALKEGTVPDESWAALAVAGAVYGALAVAGAIAYSLRDLDHGPTLEEFWPSARANTEADLYWQAAETYTDAYFKNQPRIAPKIKVGRWGLWLLIAEFAALAVSALLSV